jgi:cation/acetate symporter
VLGMSSGLGMAIYYMVRNESWLRSVFNITAPVDLWFDITPVSAGAFGVPLGFAVIVFGSLLTKAPAAELRTMARRLRYPRAD